MNRDSLGYQTALLFVKITHEDRAGQTGIGTLRAGEIVARVNEEAIIAAGSGS